MTVQLISIPQDQEAVWSVLLVLLTHHPLLELRHVPVYLDIFQQDQEAVWSAIH